MAGKTNTTALDFALKKLLGKSNTSNLKSDAQETIGSNIQVGAATVFGISLPTSPTQTLYTVQNSAVEYVVFDISSISGTTYDANDPGGGGDGAQSAGPHGYSLALTGSYQSSTNNSKAGTYPFTDGQVLSGSAGALQIVPGFFSTDSPNPYTITIFESNGAGGIGDQIPLLDEVDWMVDTFSGILFLQDYDSNKIPAYAKGFIYVADMMNSLTGSGGGGVSGDAAAQYLVLQATSSLTAERVFTPSTGISASDGGSGGNYSLSIDNSVVATLTGSQFSGNIGVTGSIEATTFFSGSMFKAPILSGSLTKLHNDTSYLVAGSGISIITGSTGQVTITNDGTVGDITGVAAGTGLTGGGTSGDVTLNINDSIVATLTGSQFSGNVGITGSLEVTTGLSGSLTHLSDGTSYLIAGNNIQIATGSSGAITIVGTSTGDITSVVAGTGLTGGGASGDVTLNINDSIVATLTGSQFSGNIGVTGSIGSTTIITSPAISGSLTHLSDGTSYLIAGNNIQISTGSSGAITIVGTSTGDITSVVAGTGLTGGGTSGDVTLNIKDSIVATLTGSTFSGVVSSPAFSGSLTTLQDGSSFLLPGTGISLSTGSFGAITINSTAAGGSGDQNAEFIVATSTGSLPSAKTISAGSGITIITGSNSMIVSAASILSKGRSKESYFVTASHPAVTEFSTPLSNYSDVLQAPDLIDVLVNGVLLHSGSSAQIASSLMDYRIASSGSLEFSFGLEIDDVVDAIIIVTTAGSSDNTASYLLQQATSSLPNSRTFTTGSGTTLQDSGPQGTFVFDTSPTTDLYVLTASHPLLNSLTIPDIDFAINARSFHKNQVFLNGVLMASGSTLDYTIDTPATGSLTFNLPLEEDDVVIIRQT